MTATETIPTPTPDTWSNQLEQLRARYKHVRPPILAALNILAQKPNIAIEDAKAQASLHGVRITAASVSAARTLLSRMDAPRVPATATSKTGATATLQRPARRARATESTVDAEALIRGVVGKLQTQSSAETERLRGAMRKAIHALTIALGA